MLKKIIGLVLCISLLLTAFSFDSFAVPTAPTTTVLPYAINCDGYLGGLDPNANTLDNFKSKINFPTGDSVKIFKAAGSEIASTDKVGTGMSIKFYRGNDLDNTYKAVLFGDCTGDGRIDSSDMLKIKQVVLKLVTLSDDMQMGANASGDISNVVDSSDLLAIKKSILKISNIGQISAFEGDTDLLNMDDVSTGLPKYTYMLGSGSLTLNTDAANSNSSNSILFTPTSSTGIGSGWIFNNSALWGKLQAKGIKFWIKNSKALNLKITLNSSIYSPTCVYSTVVNIPAGAGFQTVNYSSFTYESGTQLNPVDYTVFNGMTFTFNDAASVQNVYFDSLKLYAAKPYPVTLLGPDRQIDYSQYTYTGDKYLCICFDDGPSSATTPTIIKAFQDNGGRATFFVPGSHYSNDADKQIIKNESDAGNEIASHFYFHQYMTNFTPSELQFYSNKLDAEAYKVTGIKPKYLRPPYLAESWTVENYINKPLIFGYEDSVHPDYDSNTTVDQDVANILKYAVDGNIYLLHDTMPNTAQAIVQALPQLKAQGYNFVTLSEMCHIKGITLQNGKVYDNVYKPKY